MNRFIRLARLSSLIKEAAKKHDDVAALQSIFMNNYNIDPNDRSMASKVRGLAQQYYERFIGKSDPNAPVLTADTLPHQRLPDTIDGLMDLIKSVVVEKKKSKVGELSEVILKSYPNIDLKGFSEDHLSWIHKRYVEGRSENDEVIHSIEDSLPTLRRFTSVQAKWQSTPEFKTKVSNAGFGDISSIKNLSIDEMEKIISLDDSGLTVRVDGVEIKEGEYLGKFGEWNVWLPHTKETSVKIAGYDPVTYEPDTVWCTARTRGSNLFYNYIGREDYPMFLFYIIKDNPSVDNDWLSLTYISSGSRLSPDFSGRDNGYSVNRSNKGLEEKDYKRILGGLWGQIRSRIESEIEKFKSDDGNSYISPGRSSIIDLSKDVVKFNKEFTPKSNEEKKDFINVILDSDPSDDVKREIYKYLAKKDPDNLLANHMEEAKRLGLVGLEKQALEALAKEGPDIFLNDYREEAKGLGLVDLEKIALEALAKKDSYSFLDDYREEARRLGFFDSIKIAFEDLAKKNTYIFLKYYKEEVIELGFVNLIKQAFEVLAKERPNIFLDDYREEVKDLGFVDLEKQAFEALAKKDPYIFLKYYREESSSLDSFDLDKEALESLEKYLKAFAKKDPYNFLKYYRAEANDLGLVDLEKQAFQSLAQGGPKKYREEAELEDLDVTMDHRYSDSNKQALLDVTMDHRYSDSNKQALEALAKKDPYKFLDYYKEEAIELDFVDSIKIAFEDLAKKDPEYLLNWYTAEAKELGLFDIVKQALEAYAKEDPNDFLSKYKEEAKNLGLDPDKLVGRRASLANHLIKLSKALESIGMTKEASRVRYLLNIR